MNRRLFVYGLPLIGYEVVGHVFAYGDRVQINYFLGTEPLGYYAAASNLCVYIQTIFVASMVTAVTPIYMDRWENEGKAATEDFLALVMRYYACLAIPAAFGIAAVGQDLIQFLAGAKYTEGHHVIPYIITGMLIEGVAVIAAAGLTIKKRTKTMMGIVVCAALLNLGLNPLLIPSFGLQGAAVATLASFLLYTGMNYYFGRRILTIGVSLKAVTIYVLAAFAMYAAVTAVDMPEGGLRLFVKIGLGALIYPVLVLLMDRDLRQLAGAYAKPAWSMLVQKST